MTKKSYGQVRLVDSDWQIEAEPYVVIRLKRVFEKITKGRFGVIKLSNTPENCRELEWFLQRYPMEVLNPDALTAGSKAHRDEELLISDLVSGVRKPPPFDLALPPREYQSVAAALVLTTGGLIIADQVGLGKTLCAIATFTDPRTLPALVVTLSHLTHQWESEVNRFAPDLNTHIIKKTKVYDVRDKEGNFPDVLITTYHKLHGWADMLAPVLNSVVFDEGHELRRGTESLKGNAAYHIADNVSFRTALTATPFFNFGGEMYNVMRAIKPGALGTWGEFFREWCSSRYGERSVRIREPRAFGTYLRDHGLMIRRTRADVGRELPQLSKVPHYVSSDKAALDQISASAAELAKFILDQGPSLKGEKMQAAGELSYKLRQATGIAKAPYVAQFVKMLIESGEKVLLYGWHRAVYDIWLDQLGSFNPVLYTGSETAKQKQDSFNRFANGDTNLIIMSLRSGLGLDGLQHHCKTVVVGELDFSPAVHQQGIGRIFRDGQRHPVIAYYLITNTGSDPVIADILGIKKSQIDGVVDPNRPLATKQRKADDIKRLAKFYLKQVGKKRG